jgi:hypothetical protein
MAKDLAFGDFGARARERERASERESERERERAREREREILIYILHISGPRLWRFWSERERERDTTYRWTPPLEIFERERER